MEPKAKRRQFSAAYKARILQEVDRSPGQTGAIMRRENARLQRELEKAQILISAQKKLAEILGVDLPKITENGDEE